MLGYPGPPHCNTAKTVEYDPDVVIVRVVSTKHRRTRIGLDDEWIVCSTCATAALAAARLRGGCIKECGVTTRVVIFVLPVIGYLSESPIRLTMQADPFFDCNSPTDVDTQAFLIPTARLQTGVTVTAKGRCPGAAWRISTQHDNAAVYFVVNLSRDCCENMRIHFEIRNSTVTLPDTMDVFSQEPHRGVTCDSVRGSSHSGLQARPSPPTERNAPLPASHFRSDAAVAVWTMLICIRNGGGWSSLRNDLCAQINDVSHRGLQTDLRMPPAVHYSYCIVVAPDLLVSTNTGVGLAGNFRISVEGSTLWRDRQQSSGEIGVGISQGVFRKRSLHGWQPGYWALNSVALINDRAYGVRCFSQEEQ
ncbi:hypothetical protein OPT61_g1926 [Boeremia exigua]|uniref:Uncharacterized protein n=1 Tax=Boeremia exigua TaxID=749465 RepID=A0ACC2INT5_9PLEO|nr:hypothetical protein OPT61_g1926 [Boeremia exigua]